MRRSILAVLLACLLVTFGATGQAAELYGITGDGGTPKATLHVINQSDASVTPVMQLSDNGGGQAIAYNPDDGFMYHWAGYPAGNALYERIDLNTLAVTNIPLSGYSTNEIFSATYDSAIGEFLTTDLSFNFTAVTTNGLRVRLGRTSSWVKGLAFVGDTLYGGRNLVDFFTKEAHLFTIDPDTGDTTATTVVTMPGYKIYGFNGLATHPETGELWALLRREGLSGKTRILAKINPNTGVATQIGILPNGSGFAGIAFVPDPITFESAEDDIAEALAMGELDNFGVAQSLLANLWAAEDAAECGQAQAAIKMLAAFALEVEAQYGRHLTDELAEMLLADAAALIASLEE